MPRKKKNVGINPPTGKRMQPTRFAVPSMGRSNGLFTGRSQRTGASVGGERFGSDPAKQTHARQDQEYVSDSKLILGAIHHLSMPNVMYYRRLAREYDLKAQRATNPLYAEGYRRLAEGYESLAEGFSALVNAHRSAYDELSDVPQSVGEVDQPDHR